MSMLPISFLNNKGGLGRSGRSGRPGSRVISNSILEELRDGRGGVESSKGGFASMGVVAGGKDASESE